MGTPLPLTLLVPFDHGARTATRVWTATAALVGSGVAHLWVASTVGGSGALQLVALAAALAQFGAVGSLASLALTGQGPSDAMAGLLLIGTATLLAMDLVVPPGLVAAGGALADVLVAAAVTALLGGFWRRRAEDLLMLMGALVWFLWLVGPPR